MRFIITRLCCFLTPFCLMAQEIAHSTADVERFFDANHIGYVHLELTGTVQHASSSSGHIIISDKSGRLLLNCPGSTMRPSPALGDKVSISGSALLKSDMERFAIVGKINIISNGPPPLATNVSLDELNAEQHHLLDVITEGLVIDYFSDELDPNYTILLLKSGTRVMPAFVRTDSVLDPDKLLNALIRVKGIFYRTINGTRKHSGPFILVDGSAAITVVKAPPEDPFNVPALEHRLYMTPTEISKLGKQRITGKVLATWNLNRLMLRADDGRVVNVSLATGQETPTCDSIVTVAGYPETDMLRINLTRAIVRTESIADSQTEAAEPIPPETAFATLKTRKLYDVSCHGKLWKAQGTVLSPPSPTSQDGRMLLDCGAFKLPVDPGSCQNAFKGLQPNSKVEVIGRCLLECDRWQPDDIFPRIKNVVLVIRSLDDIRILARPPWWTPRRLLFVIIALFLIVIAVSGWNRLLQRLVERRGRELYRAEIDKTKTELKIDERTRLAVELHDSISQALAGIAYQLTSSKDAVRADADTALSRIETADRMLKSCRTELRHRLHDLRSDMLEEPDFEQAVRKTISQLEGDAKIILRVNVRRSLMNDTTAQDILSVIRELVSNALHHGQAQTVKIAGCADNDALRFSVRDDGIGFDPETAPGARQGHFGLVGIRYRLKRQNGDLSIESSVNGGTRVSFEIPLTNDESPSEYICK